MLDLRRNLSYAVTHQIGADIIVGTYSSDKLFPTEKQIAQEFNISRTVTREAIKMLAAKGLLVSHTGRGISVMPIERWNMFDPDVLSWMLNARPPLFLLREFTQMRLAIEPEAARLAAENHGELQKMFAIEQALKKIERRNTLCDVNSFLMADIEFHIAILSASNNSYFLQMSKFVQIAMQANIANINQLTGIITSYQSYKNIFNDIRKGNGIAAAESVRKLLNDIIQVINESLVAAD